jgi:hypothetical protein
VQNTLEMSGVAILLCTTYRPKYGERTVWSEWYDINLNEGGAFVRHVCDRSSQPKRAASIVDLAPLTSRVCSAATDWENQIKLDIWMLLIIVKRRFTPMPQSCLSMPKCFLAVHHQRTKKSLYYSTVGS